jgi:hypothetical protein
MELLSWTEATKSGAAARKWPPRPVDLATLALSVWHGLQACRYLKISAADWLVALASGAFVIGQLEKCTTAGNGHQYSVLLPTADVLETEQTMQRLRSLTEVTEVLLTSRKKFRPAFGSCFPSGADMLTIKCEGCRPWRCRVVVSSSSTCCGRRHKGA